jgi:hypothetical protein
MIDLYLCAPTEKAMTAALTAAGIINDEGFPVAGVSLDHIGPFSRVKGYDEGGEPIVVEYPEWHTNLRGSFTEEQIIALESLSVEPANPHRVWA